MQDRERFQPLTIETAVDALRPLLAASQRTFGFLPSPLARAAGSPALLKHLLAGFAAFEHSSLAPIEREVVAFAVAYEIDCHYCVALHSALLARESSHGELVEALRAGQPLAEPRLEALRRFVRSLMRERGRVPAAEWAALDVAGFSDQQALDALLGAGVYVLSTLTNVLTGAELDPAFEAFRWHKPA